MIIGIDQPIQYLPLFLISFVALIYTLRPKTCHIEKFKNMDKEKRNQKYKTALALLFLSLIGCVKYILKKLRQDTYETNLIRTNIFALMFSVAYFIYNKKIPDINLNTSIKLLLYTLIIGYFMSKFRSDSYSSGPEIYYSVFIFSGIIISYVISEKYIKSKEPDDFKEN
jgi:prolipoprotein diacylglyceryltransferase